MRAAILRAAEIIEQPGRYDFDSIDIPHDCGSGRACAIGWIAFCAGTQASEGKPLWAASVDFSNAAQRVLGLSTDADFYRRMERLEDPNGEQGGDFLWYNSPSVCAAVLRKYADRYHPEAA